MADDYIAQLEEECFLEDLKEILSGPDMQEDGSNEND